MIQRATNAVHNLVTRRVPNQRIRTLGFSIALAAALVGIAFLAIPSPQSDSAAGATGALSSATDQPVEPVSNSSTPASKLGDPALAVLSLVAFRATCVTGQAYAECLNQTDEIGSPQFQEDDERLKLAQALRFSAVSGASAELVSLMGKAALVRVRVENATASVLLVQTEAGWRIRELFD